MPTRRKRVRVAAAEQTVTAAPVPPRPPRGNRRHQLVVRPQHRAVAGFERRDLVEQRQVVVERNLAAVEVQQVVEREEHVGLAQAGGDVEHVAAERLQVAVQRLGHAVDTEVDLEVRARKPARHLLAHDEVRAVGMGGQELEAAVDGVVIGDRDQIHAARLGDAVDLVWRE